MKNIEALIEDGGDITIGKVGGIDCAASAADSHNMLALLARREGEAISALIQRLDKAIGRYYETDEVTDEINPP